MANIGGGSSDVAASSSASPVVAGGRSALETSMYETRGNDEAAEVLENVGNTHLTQWWSKDGRTVCTDEEASWANAHKSGNWLPIILKSKNKRFLMCARPLFLTFS